MIPQVSARRDADWLIRALEGLRHLGCAVVTEVLDVDFLAATREALYRVEAAILAAVGRERLARAGELGVLRLTMLYDRHFLEFLRLPPLLAVIDGTVSETAILHLQNGFILPSLPREATPSVYQNRFHPDFRRVLNGYVTSINALFAITDFEAASGGTVVVPGTHQRAAPPDPAYLEAQAVPVECPAGSMLLFDSTLWHAAGRNVSGSDRLGVNHQLTRSWIKQQMDYPRALGEAGVAGLPERTRQLLGFHTRVPASLDEYYRPVEERLYRAGQG